MATALERAVEMLTIAGKYAEDATGYLPNPIVFYDGAECDGGSINMDCENAAITLQDDYQTRANLYEETLEALQRLLIHTSECNDDYDAVGAADAVLAKAKDLGLTQGDSR